MAKNRPKVPEAPRRRRLGDLIEQGPPPPRSPHEFIQDQMRDQRRKERERKGKK